MARRRSNSGVEPRFTVGSLNATLELAVAQMDEADLEAAAAAIGRIGGRYSARNRLIMFVQMPGVSEVMGLQFWKERGRRVRKGSKGLAYLAPRTKAKGETVQAADAPAPAEGGRDIAGVCVRYVFDISQTCPAGACDECGSGDGEECAGTCTAEAPQRDAAELAEPYDLAEVEALVEAINERAKERAAGEGQEHAAEPVAEGRRASRDGDVLVLDV